jgi:transposase
MIDSHRVAKGYVRLRRDDLMLLPVDVRDWLPVGHVVWFLLDAVAAMDTSVLHRRARLGGAGRSPYDPDMLLALLVYAYAGGLRSSRKIERRCREDAAFMVISGLCYPDHVTIARFRKDNDAAMEELFAQVLRLCARAGMGSLEHVAIDGTKIAANASKAQSRDADGLRAVARRLIDEAAAVDEDEDARYGAARGDELPEQLRDPARRKQIIEELLADAAADLDRRRGKARARKADKANRALELADGAGRADQADVDARRAGLGKKVQRARRTHDRVRAQVQARHDERRARLAAGIDLGGRPAVGVDQHCRVRQAATRLEVAQADLDTFDADPAAATGKTTKRNLTDPDSRFMPVQGGGFILGYNSQLAVSADHIILATDVVTDTGDERQLQPMLARLDQGVQVMRQATNNPDLAVDTALFDAGYHSHDNLAAPGPDRLVAIGKRNKIAGDDPPTQPPGDDATPAEQMAYRLSTPDGKALYTKRGATVEPVNSHIKDQRGLRRFARRGLAAAQAELNLAALTTNLLRLFTAHGPNAIPTSR